MHPWPDLRTFLSGLSWVIVGGVATRAYMPERMTKDLDVLLAPQDGREALGRLTDAGFRMVGPLGVPGFHLVSPDGTDLDLILIEVAWLEIALAQRCQDPAGYPVLPLGFLVLMKLASARGQDLGDMTRMLGLASEAERKAVQAIIQEYAPEDLEDLETLISLGQREMNPLHGTDDAAGPT